MTPLQRLDTAYLALGQAEDALSSARRFCAFAAMAAAYPGITDRLDDALAATGAAAALVYGHLKQHPGRPGGRPLSPEERRRRYTYTREERSTHE